MLFNKLSNWFKSSIRIVLTAMVCGLLVISAANPASAATKTNNGEASLNRIQDKTDDVARSNPRGIEEITEEAQKGLNGVQGAADADKMVTPDETNATSVKEKAASFLDNLTN